MLVMGTAGTAKSKSWQLHLLQRLACLGRTVLLDWANWDERLPFCPSASSTKTLNRDCKLLAGNAHRVPRPRACTC